MNKKYILHCIANWGVPKNRQQEPAQAGPRTIRPYPASCRQPAKRAQEVWRAGCPREVPEVLPLNRLYRSGSRVGVSVWGRKKTRTPVRWGLRLFYGTDRPLVPGRHAREGWAIWWSDLWSQKGNPLRGLSWVPSIISAFTRIRTLCSVWAVGCRRLGE